jgi:hypothetical protein
LGVGIPARSGLVSAHRNNGHPQPGRYRDRYYLLSPYNAR